jgi:hypothetical protein
VLLLEHLGFLRPHFNGVLFDCSVPNAIVKIQNGNPATVNKVDPLLIGHGYVWHHTSGSHD